MGLSFGEELKKKVLENPILYNRLTHKQKKDLKMNLNSDEKKILDEFRANYKDTSHKLKTGGKIFWGLTSTAGSIFALFGLIVLIALIGFGILILLIVLGYGSISLV